ncbi:MAG: peptidyl-prolyl cis-trans isomerase [Fimbriimonadaceae bacterium]|jgi:cyclophilin family peptidyl-prolyl cis-trans isomerase|nr:peptidyl-prolyl cis-trans isomerase [Fimbriimonadaceae bacterium]
MKTALSVLALGIALTVTLSACGQAPTSTQEASPPQTTTKETKPVTTTDSKATEQDVAVLDTNLGKIVIAFLPKKAPGHVENFEKLAKKGFYDGTKFHRVIPGFMIQGGDPNSKDDDRSNDGTGDPGYKIKAEFNDVSHTRGIVSMARSQDPDSAGSQFFIVVKDSPFLDKNYTVFGRVIEGMDVADKIVNLKKDERDNPLPENPAVVKSVKIEKRAVLSQ